MKRIVEVLSFLKSHLGLFFSTLRSHPDLVLKQLVLEIRFLFPFPNYPVQKRIRGILFEFDFTHVPEVWVMYLGKYEMRIVKMMKKILHPGDTFIDVGANVGYLSAIGAGLVGKTGYVHSFEPVPEYFQRLQKMAAMNPDYKIIINQCALGDIGGNHWIDVIDIAAHSDIGLSTMVPGFMKEEERLKKVEVPICRLDNYIKRHNLNNIALIKIDVEGFEFPVLKGLRDFFMSPHLLPPIICEIRPSVYPLLGCHLKDLFDYMKSFGYVSFDLNKKRLDWREIKELTNVLFVHSF